MSITFGVGTLSLIENLPLTFVATDISASTTTMTSTNQRECVIDGVTATISAQVVSLTALLGTGAGATGSGLLLYGYLASGDTITATLGMVTASHPINTATNIPTAICPLQKFSFGTGANNITTLTVPSGGSATKVIARVQDVSLNVTYEQAQMRGGGDVFPVDTKHFDGAAEGSFTFSDTTGQQMTLFGGVYASAAADTGTWTLSGNSKPNPVSLKFQNVTNGVTSTYTLMRAYITQQTNDFSRTDYMQPSWNFMAQANNQGTVLTIQG